MSGRDPRSAFAVDTAQRLARGDLRAAEYTDACLRRVDELDGNLHAWRHIDADLARRRARDLDAYRLTGRPTGPLHGVPVGVQDIFDTADLPTTNGTVIDAGRRPTRDATAVARLRASGAVILGKTETTELGHAGDGGTRNPSDPARSAGGASGGSAAAVAAGMVPLAVAMQSSGAVIQAASLCGVVGFKPSYGLVPRTGALRRSESLDTVGVFGRCVEDVALAVDALAGHDAGDTDMQPGAPPRLLELARSAPPLKPSFAHVSQAGWAAAEHATLDGFSELGAELGERWNTFDLPDTFTDGIGAHRTLMLVDMAHNLGHYHDRGGGRLGEGPRAAIEEGRAISAVDYLSALDWREVLFTGVERIFERYEVIATPAVAGEPPASGGTADNAAFCILWTLFGLPVVSLPLLEGPNRLPVGVQLVGRRGHDGRLLRTARDLCTLVAGGADEE